MKLAAGPRVTFSPQVFEFSVEGRKSTRGLEPEDGSSDSEPD